MKKNVKDFLKYLEKETSITIDLTTASPTEKIYNSINQPVLINVLGINQGKLGLAVISCGCKNCKNVISVEVLYGANAGEFTHAKSVQNKIKSVVPTIEVKLRNVNENE
jgi:hypothetical protein